MQIKLSRVVIALLAPIPQFASVEGHVQLLLTKNSDMHYANHHCLASGRAAAFRDCLLLFHEGRVVSASAPPAGKTVIIMRKLSLNNLLTGRLLDFRLFRKAKMFYQVFNDGLWLISCMFFNKRLTFVFTIVNGIETAKNSSAPQWRSAYVICFFFRKVSLGLRATVVLTESSEWRTRCATEPCIWLGCFSPSWHWHRLFQLFPNHRWSTSW